MSPVIRYKRPRLIRTAQIARSSSTIVRYLQLNGHIDKTTLNWALRDTNKVQWQQFYMLPTIQKTIDHPPGRPIVSRINGPTENFPNGWTTAPLPPKLCPRHTTCAAGATGLEPPLRSIRRQRPACDIECGWTVHQYPPWRPPHYLPSFSWQWNGLQ